MIERMVRLRLLPLLAAVMVLTLLEEVLLLHRTVEESFPPKSARCPHWRSAARAIRSDACGSAGPVGAIPVAIEIANAAVNAQVEQQQIVDGVMP
ncbi:MAG: hypothetical protein R2839_00735 [Thermomicrobiales bacterium]